MCARRDLQIQDCYQVTTIILTNLETKVEGMQDFAQKLLVCMLVPYSF